MNIPKSLISTVALSTLLMFSVACDNNSKNATVANDTTENKETSLEQEAKLLKNEKGETIKVVYYAEGKEVAVKITKDGTEHQLKAKGTNNKGEPIFTDDTFAWEIMEGGTSGRLTNKAGEFQVYKPENE
jgi:hypothetical protein